MRLRWWLLGAAAMMTLGALIVFFTDPEHNAYLAPFVGIVLGLPIVLVIFLPIPVAIGMAISAVFWLMDSFSREKSVSMGDESSRKE